MRKAKNYNLVILVGLILATVLVQVTVTNISNSTETAVAEKELTTSTLTYVNHNPIWIDGDVDFAEQATDEGWPGTGTSSDPFIISGYRISNSTHTPIQIWNTECYWELKYNNLTTGRIIDATDINNTNHGVIANNYIHDIHGGILVRAVSGLLIENNIVTGTSSTSIDIVTIIDNCTIRNNIVFDIVVHGIYVRECNDSLIYNNTITDIVGEGMYIRGGSDSVIHSNNITNIVKHGIRIDRYCDDIVVRDNLIQNSNDGINCLGSNNEILKNSISDSSGSGISLLYRSNLASFCSNYTIMGNTIINATEYSVIIDEFCTGNIVSYNNFYNSSYSCHISDSGVANVFSMNYYDTWTTPDADSDDYVDVAYQADGDSENEDPLPLAAPCTQIPDVVHDTETTTQTTTTNERDVPDVDLVPIAIIGTVGVVVVVGILVVKKK
ncbi:MAG: right-handed parallel beta-helix repeat-containing protein [Candidatus Thorarchaeota archaeon]